MSQPSGTQHGHGHGHGHGHSEAPADPRRWRLLVLLCLAQFMVILDVTVVNVALPMIESGLDLDRAAVPWVVTAYTLTFGGLLMLGGRLADLVGKRRIFLTGLVIFTVASVGSGLAISGTMLVVARGLQGVGAAMLSPAALSIITTTFAGADRNRALGVWAAIGGAGAAIGVLLGGVLSAGPGWEWAFFINVPVGVAVFLALPVSEVDGRVHGGSRPDLAGAVLITAAGGLIIYALINAGGAGWGAVSTLVPLGVGILAAALFVVVERKVAAPLVPLVLLRQRPVIAGNLVMVAAAGLLIASFFLASLYAQHVLRMGPLETGLLFLPVAIVITIGAHLGARMITASGWRPVAGIGFAVAAVGFFLLSRVPADGSAWVHLLPGFAIAGAGLATTFVTATTSAMTAVEHSMAGVVSGLVNTGHEIGAALGVAFVAAIAGAGVEGAVDTSVQVQGFGSAFLAAGVAALVAAALSVVLLPGGKPDPSHGPMMAH